MGYLVDAEGRGHLWVVPIAYTYAIIVQEGEEKSADNSSFLE